MELSSRICQVEGEVEHSSKTCQIEGGVSGAV